MQSVLDFRDSLIEYLTQQKQFEQADIDKNKQLTEEQKIENGLLIKDAEVVCVFSHSFELRTDEDNTKIKVGDNVLLRFDKEVYNAKVIDMGIDSISVDTISPLHLHDKVRIEIIESIYLDPLISLLQVIDEGKPGAFFLKQLAGIEKPTNTSIGRININDIYNLPDFLNEKQLDVISDSLQRPSAYCIQGPPGTGKTAVLAAIANGFSEKEKDVLVISNTHQAVNNALEKIVQLDSSANPVKVGEMLKAEGLHSNITVSETYSDYLKLRKGRNKKKVGDIVGMTLHAAIINLGLRNSGFQPQIVLVDEAGQMPMPYASVIGAFGSGSIIFIGDDNQMPPIFHEKLIGHDFSKSIFSFLCEKYPNLRHTLNVTYRMNEEITEFIDQHFYGAKDPSQKLTASDFSKNRKFPIEIKTQVESTINKLLTQEKSICYCKVDSSTSCTECNLAEAEMAFKLTKAAIENGLSVSDIAVITPFRKQVKQIRSVFFDAGWNSSKTPLINTVECLQGQDVECIIISFAVSDENYLNQNLGFIMDKHRLNVMISRAKTKVLILMSNNLSAQFTIF